MDTPALASPPLGPLARRRALARIPGSGSPLELAHLLRDATGFFHRRFHRHGRVFRTRLVYPVVFAIGEEANRTMLVTRRTEVSFGLGYAATAVRRVFEGSIMLQDGAAHDRMRDILNPAVGTLAVRESAAAVRTVWERAAERLDHDGARDAYTLAQRTTFDVAANVLIGLELGDEAERFRPHFERLIEGIMAPTNVRVPYGRLDRALDAREALARLLGPRIEAARARPPQGLVGQLAHHRDPIGAPLPIDEIVSHLLLLFWAGYDTTASSAAWVLHELARRPEWQARLRDEASAALAANPNALELNEGLPQTAWFLQEIERMFPSALFFPRIAVRDVELLGHVVPAGTPLFYCPYLSHRDPASFDDPDTFDPERWSPARGERRAVVARLVGFGGGPRVCLGKVFAKLQLRVMLATLLSRYRLRVDADSRHTVRKLPVHHPVASLVRFDSLRD